MNMKNIIFILSLLLPFIAQAKLNVVTSITDLASITREVGGDDVNVASIARGTQDPHYIEAKPSFMTKMSRADLLITIGLGLEVGWIPPLVRGSRNPKIGAGLGFMEVGPLVNPIEVPVGTVSRAQGDVHPEGNPHVTLDPLRVATIAEKIGERLGELDPGHATAYHERAEKFASRMRRKSAEWKARLAKTGIKNVVTYHKTLNYFLRAYGIDNPIDLEPKPGIPPTSGHILEVIHTVKQKKISLILIENFFDEKIAERIKQDVPGVRIVSVPVSVEGDESIKTMDDLYENLVRVMEGR
jgi:zinc/manganese transport system substrate-binding protein